MGDITYTILKNRNPVYDYTEQVVITSNNNVVDRKTKRFQILFEAKQIMAGLKPGKVYY